jgi:hypothetical protein
MMIVAELERTSLAVLANEAKRLQKEPRGVLVDFPYLYASTKSGKSDAEQEPAP